jgi:hypothetical protein
LLCREDDERHRSLCAAEDMCGVLPNFIFYEIVRKRNFNIFQQHTTQQSVLSFVTFFTQTSSHLQYYASNSIHTIQYCFTSSSLTFISCIYIALCFQVFHKYTALTSLHLHTQFILSIALSDMLFIDLAQAVECNTYE